MSSMEDKRATRHETGRPNGEQHSRDPLKLLRDNLRVGTLLSTLVASGGSTNWR